MIRTTVADEYKHPMLADFSSIRCTFLSYTLANFFSPVWFLFYGADFSPVMHIFSQTLAVFSPIHALYISVLYAGGFLSYTLAKFLPYARIYLAGLRNSWHRREILWPRREIRRHRKFVLFGHSIYGTILSYTERLLGIEPPWRISGAAPGDLTSKTINSSNVDRGRWGSVYPTPTGSVRMPALCMFVINAHACAHVQDMTFRPSILLPCM